VPHNHKKRKSHLFTSPPTPPTTTEAHNRER
jgi:hypothetical protein